MTLANFTPSGGANIAVGTVPTACQVSGSTILVTNIGIVTVYGSLGGSASSTVNLASGFISGQPVGGTGAGSAATSIAGVAIPPNVQVPIAVSGNGYLWLATAAGVGAVNVACGA